MRKLERKYIIYILLFYLIIMITVGGISFTIIKRDAYDNYKERTGSLARYAASMLDGDEVRRYSVDAYEDARYDEIKNMLVKIKKSDTSIERLYVVAPVSAHNITYIYDIYTPDEYANEMIRELKHGYESAIDVSVMAGIKRISETGMPYEDMEIVNTSLGGLATSYAAVYDSDNRLSAIVAVGYSMRSMWKNIRVYIVCIVAAAIAIGIILTYVYYKLLIRKHFNEAANIENAVRVYVDEGGNSGTAAALKLLEHQETFSEFSENVAIILRDNREMHDRISVLSTENEHYTHEIGIASRIQDDIMSRMTRAYPESDKFEMCARVDTEKEFVENFYDYYMLDSNHLVVIMGEIRDKGVAAALFILVAKTILNNNIQSGLKINDAFDITNNQLCNGNDSAMFVMTFAGILNISTGRFTYSNAGHCAPIMVDTYHNVRPIENDETYMPLGAWEDTPYDYEEMNFLPGDLLYIYNSYILEAEDRAGNEYGRERLVSILLDNYDEELGTICKRIHEDVDAFAQKGNVAAEYTSIIIRFK